MPVTCGADSAPFQQEQLLEELEHIHSSQELAVMDLCHSVEKTVEKIEDSCKFTERLLKHGSAVEVALMKKAVSSRLLSLINNTPSVEPNTKILFETNAQKFEAAIKESFGNFKRDEEVKVSGDENTKLGMWWRSVWLSMYVPVSHGCDVFCVHHLISELEATLLNI